VKSLDEIHDMIATAQVGDGDKLLDICQALVERMRAIEAALLDLDKRKTDLPYSARQQ
jgi:hypothetical protein